MKTTKTKFKEGFILLIIILFVISSCKKDNPTPVPEPEPEPTPVPVPADTYSLTSLSMQSEAINMVYAAFHLGNTEEEDFGPVEKNAFSFKENGIDISESIDLIKSPDLVVSYKTLILVDISMANAVNIPDIQFAVKEYIKGIHPNEQIAIYSFSGELTMLIDFTNDTEALETMANAISIGVTTRNLYGALVETLQAFQIEYYPDIKQGSILLITGGDDTSGLFSLQDVMDTRSDKLIYTINTKVDAADSIGKLKELSNGSYNENAAIAELAAELIANHNAVKTRIDNYYKIKYRSVQFGDKNNTLEVAFLNGTSTSDPASCSFLFNSKDFVNILSNKISLNYGPEPVHFSQDESKTFVANTLYHINPPNFSWTSTNSDKFSLSGSSGAAIIVTATGNPGDTTTVTIIDMANQLENSVFCEIGL